MVLDIEHVLSPTDTDISPTGGILSREFGVVSKARSEANGMLNHAGKMEQFG